MNNNHKFIDLRLKFDLNTQKLTIIEFQKKDERRIYESWGKEIEILNGDNDVSPKVLYQKPDLIPDISKNNNIKRFYTFIKKRFFNG